MKKFGLLALVGLLFLASFVQAEDTPTEDELQPDTVEDDLGAAREGELKCTTYLETDIKCLYQKHRARYFQ